VLLPAAPPVATVPAEPSVVPASEVGSPPAPADGPDPPLPPEVELDPHPISIQAGAVRAITRASRGRTLMGNHVIERAASAEDKCGGQRHDQPSSIGRSNRSQFTTFRRKVAPPPRMTMPTAAAARATTR
jgi:hypothetical protein